MEEGRIGVISVTIALTTLVLGPLLSFLYRTWWSPIRIKQRMQSQGVHGPPYRFLHGNSKEVFHMKMDALRKPLDHLSHRILPRVQPYLHSWTQLYGRCVLTWAGPIPELYVAEAELAKEILQERDGTFLKLKMEGYMKKLLGNGIATSEGERWARKKKLIHQAFSPQSLKSMVPVMADCVEAMLEKWRALDQNVEIEVSEEFRLLSSDVISRTAFGNSYEQGKVIFEMIKKLSLLMVQRPYSLSLPPFLRKLMKKSKQEIEADKLEQRMEASILQIIQNREREAGDEHAMDLLSLLIRAMKCDGSSNVNGNGVSLEDIIDECKVFYFAGQDTTTSLLSWTVFLLAIHQEWQEKARNEVLMLFGNKEHPNADNLSKMKIMNMIINETLRLYPSINVIVREIEKDVKLENLTIPGKTRVTIQIMAMHHDKEKWGEDVYEFKPERFEEGVAKVKEDGAVGYMPFGVGPRMCLGKNFALNETKIAISMILQRYAFSLSPSYVHAPMRKMAVCPQHGIPLLLHPL